MTQNTDYKCPYCSSDTYVKGNKKFNSWKAVRLHANKCSKKANSYMFCEYYGPILYETLNNCKNLQEFKKLYPNITFSDSHWGKIRKSGLSSIRTASKEWDKDKILLAIKEFVHINKRIPTTRDFVKNYDYPSYRTVLDYFGLWNTAIKEAGFEPVINSGFGTPTKAEDNFTYRSKNEVYFVNKFLLNKYKYVYEKSFGNKWFTDFYLSDFNIYVEITAGLRPENMKEKIKFSIENDIHLIVINVEDLYRDNFDFDLLIKSKLNCL